MKSVQLRTCINCELDKPCLSSTFNWFGGEGVTSFISNKGDCVTKSNMTANISYMNLTNIWWRKSDTVHIIMEL